MKTKLITSIDHYCPIDSPTLRCPQRRNKNQVVQVCVKYVKHPPPCHFEPYESGKLKTKDYKEPEEI